jgi:alpha-tubulin suppressor-like RCC1 family protein
MKYKTYWLAGLLCPMLVGNANAVPATISASQFHTVFIDNGDVFGMGSNENGEIAIATTSEHRTPYFTGFQNAKSVHTNYHRTAIINADGSAVIFGKNWATGYYANRALASSGVTDIALTYKDTFYISGGNLYRHSDTDSGPVLIVSGVKQIAGGRDHLVILFNDGTVGTSGQNNRGQLGDGSTTSSATIKKLSISSVVEVAAGENTSFARTASGQVFAWGANTRSELGLGTTTDQLQPATIAVTAKKILPGLTHTVLIRDDNTVWAAGWHDWISADWTIYNTNKTFIQMPIGTVKDAAVGGDQTIVSMGQAGQLQGWGGNVYGKLGDGTNVERHTLTTTFFTPIAPPSTTTPSNSVCEKAKTMPISSISLNVALTCKIPIYTSMNQCIKANKRVPGIGELCKSIIIPADRGQQEKTTNK